MTPETLNNHVRAFGGWVPEASDIVILILGQTGSGKSTFINVAAANNVARVADSFNACTKDITPFVVQHPKNQTRVVLVDTPGFSDTWADDLVILKRIVNWLKQLEGKVKARGIIFLHEITQPRISDHDHDHMLLIKLANLAKGKILKNVVLVTTKWDELVSQATGMRRETKLLSVWKSLFEKGLTISPFEKGMNSAWQIVDTIQLHQGDQSAVFQELDRLFEQPLKKSKAAPSKGVSMFGKDIVFSRLWDSVKSEPQSISTRPSTMDDIEKSVAFSKRGEYEAAMRAIDLAFIDANGDADMIRFLMLVKSIIIFSAGKEHEGMARVIDLVDIRPGQNSPMCRTIEAYMYNQQGISAFNEKEYDKAIAMFTNAIKLGPFDLQFPRLETVSSIFGWKFDTLWPLIHQKKCEALRAADRLREAVQLLQDMMCKFDEGTKGERAFLNWSTAFKRECIAASVMEAEAAARAKCDDKAIDWYSAAINLDPLQDDLFLRRSKARAAKALWKGALADAQEAIKLNPSSPWGFEMEHAARHALRDYDNAIIAFNTMLSKLDCANDPQTRQLRRQYTSTSETQGMIQKTVFAELANAPLRLLNTHTGLLCDREARLKAFEVSMEYKELVSSIMTLPESDCIQEAVKKFLQYVMLSHRWEGREPQLSDVQDKNIYELGPVHNITKLQKFCEIARRRGHRWAWIDTCCIDKNNNVEVQKSLIAMFSWYRNAALTITYLSDVSGSSLCGGLARSAWRTRGWILQEFLASLVVLFFRKDWALYGDESSNHKESNAILGEVEEATGIDRHALANFRPGSGDVRLKLQWASTRITTEEEDIAYSLMGIFDVQIPIIYGERKEKALGRLLQEVIAHSCDVTILDWIGKASAFNSCLPEDISCFKTLPFAPPILTKEERDDITSSLCAAVLCDAATQLYDQLRDLPGPRFANRRLTLPCIVYPVTIVQRREQDGGAGRSSYGITATGLKDLCITTFDALTAVSNTNLPRSKSKYLLVRPWSLDLLEHCAEDSESGHTLDILDADTNSMNHAEAEHRTASRLLVGLGQPFSTLLLVRLHGAEYKRIACDGQIIAQVSNLNDVPKSIDIRTLDIL